MCLKTEGEKKGLALLMELTPERVIHPTTKVQTNLLQAGAAGLVMEVSLVEAVGWNPETHNALAPAQKTPTFIADNVPTYHPSPPPLPGKCDAGWCREGNSNTTTWVS